MAKRSKRQVYAPNGHLKQFEFIADFQGGLNNTFANNLMEDSQLRELSNFSIEGGGTIKKRVGTILDDAIPTISLEPTEVDGFIQIDNTTKFWLINGSIRNEDGLRLSYYTYNEVNDNYNNEGISGAYTVNSPDDSGYVPLEGKAFSYAINEGLIYWKLKDKILVYPEKGGWWLNEEGNIVVDRNSGLPRYSLDNSFKAWIELAAYQPTFQEKQTSGSNLLAEAPDSRVLKYSPFETAQRIGTTSSILLRRILSGRKRILELNNGSSYIFGVNPESVNEQFLAQKLNANYAIEGPAINFEEYFPYKGSAASVDVIDWNETEALVYATLGEFDTYKKNFVLFNKDTGRIEDSTEIEIDYDRNNLPNGYTFLRWTYLQWTNILANSQGLVKTGPTTFLIGAQLRDAQDDRVLQIIEVDLENPTEQKIVYTRLGDWLNAAIMPLPNGNYLVEPQGVNENELYIFTNDFSNIIAGPVILEGNYLYWEHLGTQGVLTRLDGSFDDYKEYRAADLAELTVNVSNPFQPPQLYLESRNQYLNWNSDFDYNGLNTYRYSREEDEGVVTWTLDTELEYPAPNLVYGSIRQILRNNDIISVGRAQQSDTSDTKYIVTRANGALYPEIDITTEALTAEGIWLDKAFPIVGQPFSANISFTSDTIENIESHYYFWRLDRVDQLDLEEPPEPPEDPEEWIKGDYFGKLYTLNNQEGYQIKAWYAPEIEDEDDETVGPNLDDIRDVTAQVSAFSLIQEEFIANNKITAQDLSEYKIFKFKGQLLLYGDNKIYVSEIGNFNYFPYLLSLENPIGELKIRSIKFLQNVLLVLTNKNIYTLKGSNPGDFQLTLINDEIGIASEASSVNISNKVAFLAKDGVYTANSLAISGGDNLNIKKLDLEVENLTNKTVNITEGTAVYFDNKYILNIDVQEEGKDLRHILLIYNADWAHWVLYESEYFDFSTMYTSEGVLYGVRESVPEILRFGYIDSNGNQIYKDRMEFDEEGNLIEDSGSNIVSRVRTKDYDFDYSLHLKRFKELQITIDSKNFKTKFYVDAFVDGNQVLNSRVLYPKQTGNQILWTKTPIDPSTNKQEKGTIDIEAEVSYNKNTSFNDSPISNSENNLVYNRYRVSGKGKQSYAVIEHDDNTPFEINYLGYVIKLRKPK